MGQRANLIIVESGGYSLYYSHWCANTITRDLFWGPQHAIDFVRAQRAVDESGWLNNVWAEGAAVIDCDHRVLLLYGGEDVLYDVPLRRIYLGMLRRVWRGWDIRWAHEGIAEIADYVGYPRINVISTDDDMHTSDGALSPPEEHDWTDLVGSFRSADDRLQLYPLAGDVEFYLLAGPRLEVQRHCSNALEYVPLDQWVKDGFPTGGFHIDLTSKRVDYWTAKDVPDVPRQVSEIWNGWNVTWHRDEFEFQLKTTAGRLRFPIHKRERLERQLREMLLRDCGRSPVETILELTEKDRKEGKDVQINLWALRHDRLELDHAERQRIVDISLISDNGSEPVVN